MKKARLRIYGKPRRAMQSVSVLSLASRPMGRPSTSMPCHPAHGKVLSRIFNIFKNMRLRTRTQHAW
jgi:hypothetical protein